MRIAIGYDMSVEAERAVAVVARARWPTASLVRIVTSSAGLVDVSSSAGVRGVRAHVKRVQSSLEEAHARISADLEASGLTVESSITSGDAGGAIVADAYEWGADLIVVGARPQSPLSANVMGSVSDEVSDRAACPVLVVRVEALERVLVAVDHSPASERVIETVASWPLFADAGLRVLSVLPREEQADQVEQLAGPSAAAASQSVARALEALEVAGRNAEARVRFGNPSAHILAAAREWPADLVVVGSSGKSRVQRLLLGSVAKAVVQGAGASVLVVRGPRAGA